MTDSGPKLPDPEGAAPPPPPTLPGSDPSATPVAPAMEPTVQMPMTNVPPAAVGGMPPLGPDDTALASDDDEVPWYKKPAGIAAIAIVVLALLGAIAWLVWGGGDDDVDEATATSSRLIIETTDTAGGVIDVGFAVVVDGPAGAEKSFVWLRPDGVAPGDIAGNNTGPSGRVDFEWEADATVADPAEWTSTVTAVAQVPAGWTPPGPSVTCTRRPVEGPETAVVMNIELDSTDATIARVGTVTFPNYRFAPGDAVTCRLVAGAPVPTTAESTVPATTPETTTVETTIPDTTVAATTVPETTAAPTTAAPVTTVAPTVPPVVPPVIVPPAPGDTAWDVIESNPDLAGLRSLIEAADPSVRELLEDPDATITLFAPSNAAIEAADLDLTDEAAVTALLLAHVNGTEALTGAQVFDGRPSVDVLEGGPQPVDDENATIGGAAVLVADVAPDNGIIHVIDAVLSIQP